MLQASSLEGTEKISFRLFYHSAPLCCNYKRYSSTFDASKAGIFNTFEQRNKPLPLGICNSEHL